MGRPAPGTKRNHPPKKTTGRLKLEGNLQGHKRRHKKPTKSAKRGGKTSSRKIKKNLR